MKKDKKLKSEPHHGLDDYPYFIDDSKMPTPEEASKFPPTPEIDAEFEKDIERIGREFGIFN